MLNKVENIVAKGEIAHHEQFQLWPQCFQKSSTAIASKRVCRWERVLLQCKLIVDHSPILSEDETRSMLEVVKKINAGLMTLVAEIH